MLPNQTYRDYWIDKTDDVIEKVLAEIGNKKDEREIMNGE
jgi:hypothetical protein